MRRLSVNLNKIAWLRNGRSIHAQPSLLHMAELVLASGVRGITVHPRPDQRHIRPEDVYALADKLTTVSEAVEFNIEGNPFAGASGDYPGFMALIEQTKPDQCTLVPDADNQLTSDHGFHPTQFTDQLKAIIARLKSWGVRSSLFMDPNPAHMAAAAATGVDRVELYTGPYAEAYAEDATGAPLPAVQPIWDQFAASAEAAQAAGLGVNAGHDLDTHNLPYFLQIPQIEEVSIGHALISDALLWGLEESVRRYQQLVEG